MSQDNFKAIIESLLFISEKPLLIEQIHRLLSDLEPVDIRRILDELKSEYEAANRGMRIIEIAGGFQMVVPPEFSALLKKFYRQPKERLTQATLETLAIIAYKQPITRMEIGQIRDVDVSGIVKNLISKGLVRIAGRKKSPGRPFVYATSRQFLEYFGLNSLEELPPIQEFAP